MTVPPGPTASQLRAAIDAGGANDKVDALDPAAAPMETDAEAGGVSPTPGEIRLAYAEEVVPGSSQVPSRPNTSIPLRKSMGASTKGIVFMVAGVLSLLVVIFIVLTSA